MKSLAVTMTAGMLVIAASCFVNRVSSDFECDPGDDCGPGRMCDQGFCVLESCPPQCSGGCDTVEKTCDINCNSVNECAIAQCPDGYACTIDCSRMNACGLVDCTTATSCRIECSDRFSCGSITCGSGPCDVRCTDNDACGNINCGGSCACDVQCSTIGQQCSTMSCPTGTALPCTEDGTTTTTCASDQQAGCGTCQ